MKRIIMFVLLFAALKVAGQTTGYLRFDTVRIMKQNGSCELYVINKTKDSLGLLTNIGGGLTSFKRARVLSDTTFIIGNDTLKIVGRPGSGGSVNNRFSVTKGTADSLQLLNDERSLKRNHSYTTMHDGTRRWNPSYWAFIDKYYADTATEDQSNVGGSSTVKLSNGNYLTAYTGFGSNPEDGGSSTIYAINSTDNLRSFTNKRQIVALDTVDAHFGPSLYVKGSNLSTGDTVILIWCTQINGSDYNYVGDVRTRQSNDGGATWGSISILRAAAGEYYNNFPNRIFRTNSGKLLYPFEKLTPGAIGPSVSNGFDPRMLVSTNNGSTWSYSTAIPVATDSGCVETGFYQRTGETRLYWYGRSFRKSLVYTAYSDDDGVTWTTPDYMNFSSPNAAVTIRYLSNLDCFIGFANRTNGATQFDKRKYLNGFLSYDGQNFRQFMCLDTALENSAGVIGLTDIIPTDSATVVIYSFFHPTTNYGDMKVARIPRSHLSSAFENTGAGIGIPSGGDADRMAPYIPNIRWNTTGYYEGGMGTMFGYGALLATGDLVDGVYPFKTMRLKSNSQIGRITLYNRDAHPSYYGDYECEKSYGNSYNMGAGQIVGKFGWNTMSGIWGITAGTDAGGFSNVEIVAKTTNAVGTTIEPWRTTAEGTFKINTDANGTNVDGRRLYVNGSIGANKDSTLQVGSVTTETVLLIDTTTGRFKRVNPSVLSGSATTLYTGDGTLGANRTVNTGGFTTTWTGPNDSETSFTVANTGTTAASAIAGTATGTTSTGVSGTSTQYIGVFGSSTSNTGVQGQSSSGVGVIGISSTGAALRGQINPSSNNAIEPIVTLLRTSSSGAGANGLGAAIQYELETATNGTSQTAGSLAFQWTDATNATRTSAFEIYGVNSATTARKAALGGAGQWIWDAYGAGTFTGTPTGSLQTTSAGAIIEGPMLAAGTYTPTITGVTNVTGTTAYACQYSRVGNVVTVSGKVNIDFTSTGLTEIGISLPIASAISNDFEVAGVGSTGENTISGAILGDATNNRAHFAFSTSSSAGYNFFFTFTYQVL